MQYPINGDVTIKMRGSFGFRVCDLCLRARASALTILFVDDPQPPHCVYILLCMHVCASVCTAAVVVNAVSGEDWTGGWTDGRVQSGW